MGGYQILIDGIAIGFVLGLTVSYLYYRYRQSQARRSKDDIDHLIEEFQEYYRKVEEENSEPYD